MTGRPLRRVDADAFRCWARRAYDGLQRARAGIDALNVFPVADADTGTNLTLTLQAVVEHLEGPETVGRGLAEVAATAARASLWGARGSSGAIVSQYLHGMADVFADAAMPAPGEADGAAMQRALARGADAAYAAVAEPVEGTVLSVARGAAKAAAAADPADLVEVIRAATAAAHEELARTQAQLPVLAAAGVIDAGGQGLVVMLDALYDVVTGAEPAPTHGRVDERSSPERGPAGVQPAAGSPHGYEVQYLLDAPPHVLDGLREVLSRLGDAVAVVRGDGTHNVHVHVDDVGAAIEAGIDVGRPHRIRVTRFADQVAAAASRRQAARSRVVSVCPPGGLAELFRAADSVVLEPDEGAVSAARIAAAVHDTRSHQVVLLPNSRELRDVADAAVALVGASCAVTVVPTRSPLQGLAAVAVHDASRRFDEDVVAMSTAAAATRYAEVTVAEVDALTSAGPCRAGDVLGLIDDDVAVVGSDPTEVARGLVDRMLIGGGELVTIVTGVDFATEVATLLVDYVAATRPAVEVVHYPAGLPGARILVGVE